MLKILKLYLRCKLSNFLKFIKGIKKYETLSNIS